MIAALRTRFFIEAKKIIILALPIIIGQLAIFSLGFTDTLMVGRLGATELAAAAFANSIFVIGLIFAIGFASPLSALVAKARGAHSAHECGEYFRHAVMLNAVLGVFLVGALHALIFLFPYMGQSPEVIQIAKRFYILVVLSLPFTFVFQTYKQFVDAFERTRIGMTIVILGVVANAIGNYVLIYGKYGFPALGVNGSALATLFSSMVMAITIIIYVHRLCFFKKYISGIWLSMPNKKYFLPLIRLGLTGGFVSFFEIMAFSVASIMMGWFGAKALAAHQIAINIATISFLIAVGMGSAASIRVGYELGAGSKSAARFAGLTAIFISFIYVLLAAAGLGLVKEIIPSIYITDSEVLSLAAKMLGIVAIFQMFDVIQACSIGALRGLTDVKWPLIIAFIGYWLLSLPLGYLLGFTFKFGPLGLTLGLWIGLVFVGLGLLARFFYLTKGSEN